MENACPQSRDLRVDVAHVSSIVKAGRALLTTSRSAQTIRKWSRNTTMQVHERSISGYYGDWSAPIKQIIDADGQSLNVGVPGSERVNQETRSDGRVFQPNVLVVNPCGPVGGKRPFDAPAGHPTA